MYVFQHERIMRKIMDHAVSCVYEVFVCFLTYLPLFFPVIQQSILTHFLDCLPHL